MNKAKIRYCKKYCDNKGITLVELIVVLVVLAVLASIIIPQLLGFIARARGSKLLIRGKSLMNAVQTQYLTLYAQAPPADVDGNPYTIETAYNGEINGTETPYLKKAATLAEMPESNAGFFFMTAQPQQTGDMEYITAKHESWKIKYFMYFEGDNAVYYNGNSWEDGLSFYTAYNKIKELSESKSVPHGTLFRYPKL
ncbi:MAG: prepilin-type N-terminal cleavage/methylation domain-containing protein [Lachnospiraceae bacterium]|nr:prepilin-type N-terminal cleavage/methylation domain-containing protein [Lachnospiraceae bacterium]